MNRVTIGVPYLIGLIVVGLLVFYHGRLVASQNLEEKSELSHISIYDEENLLVLSLKDVGKYHGGICPCVVAGFRVTQLAISQLWKEEIPKRKDFKIISALPSMGSQDAFEFITRAKTRKDFRIELPEGTDLANITMDNWVFVVIRKSTHERVKILLRDEVFPEGSERFFDLRKKVKFEKTATLKEKETFESAKKELKQRLMDWQTDELFGSERR